MGKYEEKIKPSFAEIRRCYDALCPESDICRRFGISRSSFNRYRSEHPEFGALIDECREEADQTAADQVESALLKRATGYDVDADEVRHIPPDVRAAIFWLKNRRPNRWKERKNEETPGTPVIRLSVTESEL